MEINDFEVISYNIEAARGKLAAYDPLQHTPERQSNLRF
jgi:hypothetical protein